LGIKRKFETRDCFLFIHANEQQSFAIKLKMVNFRTSGNNLYGFSLCVHHLYSHNFLFAQI